MIKKRTGIKFIFNELTKKKYGIGALQNNVEHEHGNNSDVPLISDMLEIKNSIKRGGFCPYHEDLIDCHEKTHMIYWKKSIHHSQ